MGVETRSSGGILEMLIGRRLSITGDIFGPLRAFVGGLLLTIRSATYIDSKRSIEMPFHQRITPQRGEDRACVSDAIRAGIL